MKTLQSVKSFLMVAVGVFCIYSSIMINKEVSPGHRRFMEEQFERDAFARSGIQRATAYAVIDVSAGISILVEGFRLAFLITGMALIVCAIPVKTGKEEEKEEK